MATFESDLLDENPYGIVATSRALSHAWSGEVEMRQGISTKKPVMQAWFRRGEIDPATNERTPVAEVYTVRFELYQPSPDAASGSPIVAAECEAWINARVAGNTITRKVSVGQGTALSITLEAIDISLFDVSDTGEEVGASSPGLPYRVAVHVAPGTRASYLQPPVLRAVTSFLNGAVGAFYGTIDLNGASTAVYPVPLNAGVDSVEILAVAGPTGQPSTEVSVSCMAGGDTTKYWNASQREGFVKLPPGTTHVVLTNLTPSESAVTQVVTLTWGIEG